MSKMFIITVDTEGDNLWQWQEGKVITTKNTAYIPRFQELCEKFGFVPSYLTNYEMAMDDIWVQYSKKKRESGKCEIGLHIHAWNSPPIVPLENKFGGNAYITEYDDSIIREKIHFLKELLSKRFECKIQSARSGRWATDNRYFEALADEGITVDCTIAPYINFTGIPGCSVQNGPNYINCKTIPHEISPGVLEIPMTTRVVKWNSSGSFKHRIKSLLIGEKMWLRPIKLSKDYLKALTNKVIGEGTDYLEFMIHSSELMPGGSPYYKTQEDIEEQFKLMNWYFKYVSDIGFEGLCLSDYARIIRGE